MYNADSIIYNGKNSEEYGLAIAYMDTPTVDTGLARETTKNEYNVRRRKLNYYGAKFTNGIALEITFIKNPCSGKDEDNFFTLEESTAINEWLTEPETPTTLLVNNDETMQLTYNAIVTNVEDTIIRGRVAKTVTFETDSPFARQRPVTISIKGDAIKEIRPGSDIYKVMYIPIYKTFKNMSASVAYPILKIQKNDLESNTKKITETFTYKTSRYFTLSYDYSKGIQYKINGEDAGSNWTVTQRSNGEWRLEVDKSQLQKGDILSFEYEYNIIVCSIINETDNNQTIKLNLDKYFKDGIIINCDRMRITRIGDENQVPILISDIISDPNEETIFYWLRLLKGENMVGVSGNCTVTITYTPERRTGSV